MISGRIDASVLFSRCTCLRPVRRDWSDLCDNLPHLFPLRREHGGLWFLCWGNCDLGKMHVMAVDNSLLSMFTTYFTPLAVDIKTWSLSYIAQKWCSRRCACLFMERLDQKVRRYTAAGAQAWLTRQQKLLSCPKEKHRCTSLEHFPS